MHVQLGAAQLHLTLQRLQPYALTHYAVCCCLAPACLQEEIVDETDNEPINTRVLTMSLSPGMRRLLLASQQRMAAAILDPRSAAAGPAQAPTGAAGASSSSSAAHAAPAPQAGVQNP